MKHVPFRSLLGLLPVLVLSSCGDRGAGETAGFDFDCRGWFRGNTHTHSLWSDGNDFPEMIVEWYRDEGYDFVALSDHNILATSEKWMDVAAIAKRQRAVGRSAMEKYRARFEGENWIETRQSGEKTEVRLKRIDEYRKLFEVPGKFLVVQAEEITSSSGEGKPVHINAINLPGSEPLKAVGKDESLSGEETMRTIFRRVTDRETETGVPILAHLNHPNFQWALTAEELARVAEGRFFEVYNGHPGVNHLGDETRPGDEKIWDIANTLRLAELGHAPLLGVATDDSHTYHGGDVSPGRGWLMVGADALEGDALVRALKAGRFYASSGVFLDRIAWDPRSRRLSLSIRPEDGVTYTTELIGTHKGYNAAAAEGKTGIGEVLASATGAEVVLTVPDDALFARATVTASARSKNPAYEGQKKQAWTQPVGWR
ncbi:MAG: hypothetical protein KDM91_13805 [Verrucomicrobiae bacterium]|nr:hypothetical protein [Verrucomicrobiae bacterium]